MKPRDYVKLYKETLVKEDGFELLAQKAVIQAFIADVAAQWNEEKHNRINAAKILSKADETWRELSKLLTGFEPEKFSELIRKTFPVAWVMWMMEKEKNEQR